MKQPRRIEIDVPPAGGRSPFRVGAATSVLQQLTDAPEEGFRFAKLAETVGVSRSTAWRGVQLLERLGAVTTRKTARQTHVSVDTARLWPTTWGSRHWSVSSSSATSLAGRRTDEATLTPS